MLTGGQESNMIWLEDEMAAEQAQNLHKTQIYEAESPSIQPSMPLPNLFESNALQYEKVC